MAAVHIGPGAPPIALSGRRAATASLEHLDDLTLGRAAIAPPALAQREQDGRDDLAGFVRRSALDAYATADRMAALARHRVADRGYPTTALGRKLALIAQLLSCRCSGFESERPFVLADLVNGVRGEAP